MKAKKATKPKYTTVVTRWMYDDKSRARLIARERRKERERVARIVERCIVAKIKDLEEDNPPSRRVHEVQKQFDALDWQIKQAITPATKRKTRSKE